MKKILIALFLLAIFSVAQADWMGYYTTSDNIRVQITSIDTLGRDLAMDSVHVAVNYHDEATANSASYTARYATAGAGSAVIDSFLNGAAIYYYFFDAVADIDNGEGDGNYSGDVTLWAQGEAFHKTFSFAIGNAPANIVTIEAAAIKAASFAAGAITPTVAPYLAYFDTLIYAGPRSLGIYIDSAAANTNTVLGTDGTSKYPVSTIAAAKTLATALGYNRYYFLNASTFNDAANDLASSHQNWEFIGIGNSNALAFGGQRVDESRFENMDLSGAMHASGGNVLYTNCTLGYITANFNGHAFNCLLADTIVVKADQDIEFVRCQSDVGGNRTPTIDLAGGSSVVQLRGYSGGIRIMNGASNDTISIETEGQVIIASNNTSLNITLRGMLTITDNGTTTNLTKDAVFTRQEADLWVWANADTAQPDSSDLGVWLVNNLSGAAGGLDTLAEAFVDRLVGRMADSLWKSLFVDRDDVPGSFADSAKGWGATAASALDSTILSNVLHRIVWGTAVGSGSDSSTAAQRDIGAIARGTITLAQLDSAFIAIITEGIWLDDGVANTNSTVGVDGTISNPVSTLAAARILADSQGLQKYYIKDNSSFTLDATYENWVFMGMGRGNSINLGSQDADYSDFYNLMITGTQGGTGVILLDRCYLNTPDSLEALVTRSSLSDTISLRVSTNTVFDQCYSNIAGNNTPGLDLNSAGTIEVGIRHYSGGITIFNGISTHTISCESAGQIVIDASCTSINITARGNMTITDNGTTTNLTDNAVFNVNAVAAYPEYLYKMVVDGSPTTIVIPVNYISEALGHEVDDVLNGMRVVPITGDAAKQVRNIVDFAITDSIITIRPGFTRSCNVGDTVLILPNRLAVEPFPLSNHEIAVSGTDAVTVGDVETGVIDNDALADDITIPKLTLGGFFMDSMWIINDNGEAVKIQTTTGNDHAIALTSVGRGISINAATGMYVAGSSNGIYVVSSGGSGISVNSGANSGSAVEFIATGTSSIGLKVSGTQRDYESTFDSTNFAQDGVGALDSSNFSAQFWDAIGNAASGLSAEQIAKIDSILNAVWTDGDTTVIAAVEALSVGGGVGANTCTLYVWDTGNSITVSGINVRANNTSGANQGQNRTNVSGIAVLNLDDGSYNLVIPMNSGYIQTTNPQPFVVSGATNDTIKVTQFSPSAPIGDLCTVYNWVKDANQNGQPHVTIEASIPPDFWPIRFDGVAIRARYSVKTDSTGLWELPIFPNTILSTAYGDSSSYYIITASDGSLGPNGIKVTVPDSASYFAIPDDN